MTPSASCSALVQRFETCARRLDSGLYAAYMPTPKDRPTIGWGTTGPDIVLGLEWTQTQCDERFSADLAKFAIRVSALLNSTTSQAQFDAMVSLAYNIGVGAFTTSTLLRLHNAGNYAGAAAQFAVWNKQAGKVLQGLVTRRAAEAALYQSS